MRAFFFTAAIPAALFANMVTGRKKKNVCCRETFLRAALLCAKQVLVVDEQQFVYFHYAEDAVIKAKEQFTKGEDEEIMEVFKAVKGWKK